MEDQSGNTAGFLFFRLKIFSRFLLFSLLFFITVNSRSQTNISGIVNNYYRVIEVIPAKAAVRLASTSGLNMNDKVMIIQMKGATVNTANTSSFGDTTSLNNAGNYEIATICSVHGDTAYLFFNLSNQYTISDKVQLVKFAEYYSANVIDTIKAMSWDNTTGTGGVVAISVTTDLTLNAPIFADSSGYSGGSAILSTGGICLPATGYTYNPNSTSPQNGASKGEGVADIASNINGGRGAPANGGGGGNYHNNGGAGGANLAAGGNGGGNSSFVGCLGNDKGLAGKALSSWNGKKIFLGGGGGAGHFNNNIPAYGGGNGGGIIFITTNSLIGNGYKISANGQIGGSNTSDGASGGGAGGTIILDVLSSYSGSLTIQANGGSGGTANDGGSVGRCYGAGGGGSGGIIYFTGSTPAVTINTTGGAAGPEVSSDAGCTLILPASGSNGSVVPGYTYTRSMSPSGYCTSILPSKVLFFKAMENQDKVWLQWRISNPELIKSFIVERANESNAWEKINDVEIKEQVESYQLIDNSPLPGINLYRLKVIEKTNNFFYSLQQKISIDVNDQFEIYPNPASTYLNVSGDLSSLTRFTISDLSGKLIWQKNLFSNDRIIRIELPTLNAGIYSIRINDSVKKLVIR